MCMDSHTARSTTSYCMTWPRAVKTGSQIIISVEFSKSEVTIGHNHWLV